MPQLDSASINLNVLYFTGGSDEHNAAVNCSSARLHQLLLLHRLKGGRPPMSFGNDSNRLQSANSCEGRCRLCPCLQPSLGRGMPGGVYTLWMRSIISEDCASICFVGPDTTMA